MNPFMAGNPFGETSDTTAIEGVFRQAQWDLDKDGQFDAELWMLPQQGVETVQELCVSSIAHLEREDWHPQETAAKGAAEAFHAISSLLSGRRLELPEHEGYSYFDLIHALERQHCTVIRSQLSMEGILSCLLDQGSVLLIVSENGWRRLMGLPPLPAYVSGWRVLQIVEAGDVRLVVNDFSSPSGYEIPVNGESLCSLPGELLEVYK